MTFGIQRSLWEPFAKPGDNRKRIALDLGPIQILRHTQSSEQLILYLGLQVQN